MRRPKHPDVCDVNCYENQQSFQRVFFFCIYRLWEAQNASAGSRNWENQTSNGGQKAEERTGELWPNVFWRDWGLEIQLQCRGQEEHSAGGTVEEGV